MTDTQTAEVSREGEICPAEIMHVSPETVTVAVAGTEGVQIPRGEWGEVEPTAGAVVDVYVDQWAEDSASIVVDARLAPRLELWRRLEAAAKSGAFVRGTVVAEVKGGFSVDIGMRGFLPSSQASLRPFDSPELVGEELEFAVTQFEGKRGNVVLSLRPILEAERAEQAKATLEGLTEGEVVDGRVVSFTQYGVFIDIGGIDGLLHSSDITWGRQSNAKEHFTLGQEVRVKVLSVDKDRAKVQLGAKQLTDDPWLSAGDRLKVGARITGKVVSLTTFGAFVEVEPGLEGMVHVSEMSWTERVVDPKQLVKKGKRVDVVVLEVDGENRRLSLGMKQTQENPWVGWAEKYPKGTKVKGPVKSLTDFGIFVGVEKGLDGLVHVGDLRWNERVTDPNSLYSKGDEVEAVVLDISPDSQRLALGIKQLSEDPWKSIAKKYPRGATVKGKVTRIADFGAFVEIEGGLEGLVHVSQIDVNRVNHPSDVVSANQEVEALVLQVDRKQRKISLSMRAVSEGLDDDYKDYLGDDGANFGNPLAEKLSQALGDESNDT